MKELEGVLQRLTPEIIRDIVLKLNKDGLVIFDQVPVLQELLRTPSGIINIEEFEDQLREGGFTGGKLQRLIAAPCENRGYIIFIYDTAFLLPSHAIRAAKNWDKLTPIMS